MTGSDLPALRLVSREGKLTFDLPASGELVIGRSLTCNIVLTDPTVSRRHAVLTITASGMMLTDQGAVSGTYVNNRLVAGAEAVRAGDTVRLGSMELVLTDAARPAGGDAQPRRWWQPRWWWQRRRWWQPWRWWQRRRR